MLRRLMRVKQYNGTSVPHCFVTIHHHDQVSVPSCSGFFSKIYSIDTITICTYLPYIYTIFIGIVGYLKASHMPKKEEIGSDKLIERRSNDKLKII